MSSCFKVKAHRAKLKACLTCLLCNKLFKNATTISECLHTFCRECINKKLIHERLDHCPICKVDLGCSPVDKLRTDNNLQELRDNIFPCEENNSQVIAIFSVPSVTLPTKTKRKSPSPSVSLSSIKVNARKAKRAAREVFTPQESDLSSSNPDDKVADAQKDDEHSEIGIVPEPSTFVSARKAKAVARIKFIRSKSAPTCQPEKITADEKKDGDHPQLETSNNGVQNSSTPDSSQEIVFNKISENNADLWKENSDLNEPLNSLVVEATSKNKCNNKSSMQENAVIPVPVDSSNSDSHWPTQQLNAATDQAESTPPKPVSIKLKFIEDLNAPAQPVIVGSNGESNEGFSPLWFALVASEETDVGARLPQIPSRYLRVKDRTLPVFFIKKYLVKQLGLASETEVEISLQGRPVSSSLQLQNLVDLWLQTVPNERIQTSVGSSAKDFIMVLSYYRKA